ncbi:helix-turn-helix transcriptional regulator [Streptomyces sp. NPDC090052]|uniref:helix-turn-helix transcriptional regulator n=1 Tax=unclassified Streptomyces TaxID=2593676 RepID=UPI00224F6B49|nr:MULTISPECIES: helix-turn-helix domain-containing protein [unclassified Streptomyces]MCX4725335.1 helix-turn-helix domain-containing protein [Streptomyces sp. NBC_01306]WSX43323.1 helix-turn-helix domain-containing protein [Streptomyces sp. NBC_00963]
MSSKGENEHSDAGEDEVLEAVGALAEPVRRRLYRYVVATPDAIGRDAAAEAAGISRSLAAFHLDKLVEAGLLAVTYRRLSGRAGPGAGRPSKLYLRAPGERAVSLPPRSYGSAGRLLAAVVDGAGLDRELQSAARAAGAAEVPVDGDGPVAVEGDPVAVLRSRGYEPYLDGTTVRLNNCPFHALADEFPALTCGMNLAYIEGLLPGCAGGEGWTAAMDPVPEGCCVALTSKTNKA